MIGKSIEEEKNKKVEHFIGRDDMNTVAHYTKHVLKYPEKIALLLTIAMFNMRYYDSLIDKYDWAEREAKYHRNRIEELKKEFNK